MKSKLKLLLALFAGFTFSISSSAQAPTISGFSPASGAVGTLITVTGTDLGNPTNFTVGGTSALVVSNDGNNLVGLVMPGAITGVVSLTTANGTGNSTGNFSITPTLYPYLQQGDKLVGSDSTSNSRQGTSVAISADGNTAVVGGLNDNSTTGAVWVYTRTGSLWTQQGPKLVGVEAVGGSKIGASLAISADGNTFISGGFGHNGTVGAAWVFTRTAGVWSQQGFLTGSDAVGNAYQGTSVGMSADGNTAIVGGGADSGNIGAIWVYQRSGGAWTQQGPKLVGSGGIGTPTQGNCALSADGNTIAIGGANDDYNNGAVWIFTQTSGVWSQQGSKLIGTGAIGMEVQGISVALSADGNTLIEGGSGDNSNFGAAWVFTRSGGVWTQQGSKLVASDAAGNSRQGTSVSITADGNTALVGGPGDHPNGATYIYTRSGGVWSQQGSKLLGTGATGPSQQGMSVSVSTDGNTGFVGGDYDNSTVGAAWAFKSCAPNTGDTTAVVCGDFTWYGNTYSSSNDYTHVLTNVGGCDSTVTLHLTVNQSSSSTLTSTICQEESIIVNGTTYDASNPSGVEVLINGNASGCDSTVTINLNVLTALTGSETSTICQEESIIVNGTTYDASNPSGVEVFTNIGVNGCDSTVTVNLSFLTALTGSETSTICQEESIIVNGTTYDASNPSGVEVFTNIGVNGCDSTVTINLNVLPALTGLETSTICQEESIIVNGTTYDASNPSGVEVFTNVGVNGCDSTVTVNLNVLPALTGLETSTICQEESIIVNGTTYDASNPSGVEVFTNVGVNGCDSTVTINLTVESAIDITITQTDGVNLSANASGAAYQWLDCDNGNAPITGETNQAFEATNNGNYAVVVTENGCSDTSNCIAVNNVGLKDLEDLSGIKIYPNPTTGTVTVSFNNMQEGQFSLELLDATGRLMTRQLIQNNSTQVSLKSYESGIYIIRISNGNRQSIHRVIKE
jgi:hypothetical protein